MDTIFDFMGDAGHGNPDVLAINTKSYREIVTLDDLYEVKGIIEEEIMAFES